MTNEPKKVLIGGWGHGIEAARLVDIAASMGIEVVEVESALKRGISAVTHKQPIDIDSIPQIYAYEPTNRRQRRAAKRGKDWRDNRELL